MSVASAGLQQVAQVVSDASTRLAAHIEQSDKGACETSLHLTEAANAIQQMNKTVHQVAQNSRSRQCRIAGNAPESRARR